jgi:adenine-specific DNA-methyltransferase
MTFNKKLESILKQNNKFCDKNGQILKQKIKASAIEFDEDLIKLLVQDTFTKEHFFKNISDSTIFDYRKFIDFTEDKNFLLDSYTKFSNKIGLSISNKHIKQIDDVVLTFPFKDCILEGGQSKEDEKKKEIFFNETLAKDEISRLFDKKIITNATKYYYENGAVQETQDFKFNRDENGTIRDNLIIKGNNLLALHTLKSNFAGKVKLIYIDPPYNTGSDSFGYNDSFNHSTWLTFMKNRLEIARELLSDDGVIFVQCDDNEQAYLKVLMDEVFYKGYLQTISVKKATTAGFKSINLCPITTKEYIFIYSKDKNNDNNSLNKLYVKAKYINDYDTYIPNIKEIPSKWEFISLNNIYFKHINVKTWQEAKNKIGNNWKEERKQFIEKFANKNYENIVSFKDLHKPTEQIKNLMIKSKLDRDKVFIFEREGQENLFFRKGRSITFYKNKFRKINGEIIPSEILSDIWTDIKWDGIAKEGFVEFKNAKKPEKLLERIIRLSTTENDIVLDYHMGTGTTCAVAHKMNRQYIGIEQMDYIETIPVERLKKVINGEQGGISKSVNWQGGGKFIYLELDKYNQKFIDDLSIATKENILNIYNEICQKGFLNYDVELKKIKENIQEFKALDLEAQKEFLVSILNKNVLYKNLSEIDDETLEIYDKLKELNKDFYDV